MTRPCGRRGARDRARPDAGQATVEFALLLPLFAACLLAVLQAALVARDQVLVVHAARAAAREASVDAGTDRVHEAARRVLPAAEVRVGSRGEVGELVAVEVSYVARTDLPIVGPLFPDPTLTARVEMRLER